MANDIISTKKNHGAKKKTPFQLQALEKYYSVDKYPKQKAMEEYAAQLNLAYNSIRIWFAERRRKERRENEVHGRSKKLLDGKPKCSSIKTGKKMNVNTVLGRSRLKNNSKNRILMNQEPDLSMDSVLDASSGSYRQNGKQPLSNHKESGYNTSSLSHRSCNLKSTMLRRNYCSVSSSNQHFGHKNHLIRPQVLFSKDYVLKKVFRKDGPQLGVEFDSLPSSFSSFHRDSGMSHSCQDSLRVSSRRRKISGTPIVEPGEPQLEAVQSRKHGIGKGLMTLWRATNPNNVKLASKFNFENGDASLVPKSSFKETLSQASRRTQQNELVSKQSTRRRKFQERKRPPSKRKKVACSKAVKEKTPHLTACKLSISEPILEQSSAQTQLLDDEELELREVQTGPNPLRCSAHLVSDGSHGCPLCKDLLARFPPQTVKMKQPLCSIPWDTNPELVQKLFKVLLFLYSNAATIEICPFTIDELAHAFTDKDSMLLGMIHVSLLKLLLIDVEREVAEGSTFRAAKHGRFLNLMHFVRQQKFDIGIWSRSLNPLTWTEILRQVLVAAGFGSEPDSMRREIYKKEKDQMAKYGLRPHTLKAELFSMLSEQGSGGLKASELAKFSQIVVFDLPDTKEEIEELICSTLSSDITLFEKIASSTYRLRISSHVKGKEINLSDTEDSGCVDDDSVGSSGSSSIYESDGYEELNAAGYSQRIVKYKRQYRRTARKLTENTEIDESSSGEAWVLGLMEGEYSDLSIDEKLNALIALIEIAGDCFSLRTEESSRATLDIIPHMLYHGSGAKIKKSLTNHLLMWKDSESSSAASKKGRSSKTRSTMATDKSEQDVHLMQSIYLGSDRRYNSYWLFLGPCDINDPGHRQVYFESSEDGHWEVINTAQALDALLSALDCRGTREARLFASLDKREAFLCQAMNDFMATEYKTRETSGSELDTNSGDGSSPISYVDNILDSAESVDRHSDAAGPVIFELGKTRKEKKQKWDCMQEFDKWIWNGFYSELSTIKKRRCFYMESLTRCVSCHDLYLKDEKHCRICHTTFELDFDLEERYAIHVATCRVTEERHEFPNHKLLSSQLQALKAAIYALEAGMPEVALSAAWIRSAHKLWVKRLLRTSSLPELLQVITDFVGAINEEWLYECTTGLGPHCALDEILVYFQTMPQTTSAVALWMIKLDNLIAPHLEKLQSEQAADTMPLLKRRRVCSIS